MIEYTDTTLGEVEPCIKGQYTFANVRNIFPAELSSALEEGIHGCEKLIRGFDRPDAVLSGVESRTSSPVRISGMRPLKVRTGDFTAEREPDMQRDHICGHGRIKDCRSNCKKIFAVL